MAGLPDILVQWEYCTVASELKPGIDFAYELVLHGTRRVFPSVDDALTELGMEGWECILCHRNDGPRRQIIPGSLIQASPWPVKYELRFKRARGNER